MNTEAEGSKDLESTNIFPINSLSSTDRKNSKSSSLSEVEDSIFLWFQNKGIRKTQPEEIIGHQRAHIKAQLVNRIRKMSAPNEGSLLLQRRSIGLSTIYV